jgi:hypothetical protein
MVLLASTFDQSKYLRAEELKQEKILRIKAVTEETVNDRSGPLNKLVVWFTTTKKGLVLNKTNNRTIRGIYGDDTAEWAGKSIVLLTIDTEVNGRPTRGIRVRIPPPKQPSGNGQMAKPPPAPQTPLADVVATRPLPEPEPEGDDFDDEIAL